MAARQEASSNWEAYKNCAGIKESMMHHPAMQALAKEVCRGCVVPNECADDAIAKQIQGGVHGGLDTDARARFDLLTNGSLNTYDIDDFIDETPTAPELTVVE